MNRAMTRVTEALWERYRGHGDTSARAKLLDSYMGLVLHAAHELRRRGAGGVEFEDLVGAGSLGLVQALEGFDTSRGLAFSTYAMPRIRGAMLDEINHRDWAPRTVRVRRRLLAQARAELQHRLGRAPDPEELAERMGVDLATYWKWAGEIEGRGLVGLDDLGGESSDLALHERIPDPFASAPGADLMEAEQLQELRNALEELPAKDRLVLSLYYYEGLTLRQIGEILHVTESRVSQIHGRAVKRLRERVEP
jgi:RNA polymerase sigma factor for flagellar operon FliA